jgi:hypothetical protein
MLMVERGRVGMVDVVGVVMERGPVGALGGGVGMAVMMEAGRVGVGMIGVVGVVMERGPVGALRGGVGVTVMMEAGRLGMIGVPGVC